MMSDLETLKSKLTSDTAESDFLLEQRTPEQRLQNIAQYAALIPFASNEDASWDKFWLAERTAGQLAAIYQEGALAEKSLPVQQAFLLALLQLLETPAKLLNTLPARHRTLYYHDLLGFTRPPPLPDSVVVSFTLARNMAQYLLPAGTALNGGQDDAGNNLTYLTDDNLLISGQLLSQLCWTRLKDPASPDGDWLLCTVVDEENNVSLPDDGIRLFSATDNETVLQQTVLLDLPLASLQGDLLVETTMTAGESSGMRLSLAGNADALMLQNTRSSDGPASYFLSSDTRQNARKDWPQAWKKTQLMVQLPLAQQFSPPESFTATLINCQDIRYRAQDGQGHLTSFSYPFGVTPRSGNTFELILPLAFSQTGGTLTIRPQWRDLPQQSFAQWYADYPQVPADNSVFNAQIYLLTDSGSEAQGDAQPLFSGTGIPQGEPLYITLPTDPDAASGYNIRVELGSPDFLQQAWQQAPTGKNVPWIPQVSRIDTRFQSAFSAGTLVNAFSRLRADTTREALYLGFSGVNPGDTLSLYWSLDAPSPVDLSWFAWNKQGTWVAVEAGLQDGTDRLSASGLWRVLLPEDAVTGCDLTQLSEEVYWIKATPTGGQPYVADGLPKLKALVPGAVTATLSDDSNVDDSHFSQGLAANSISQLVIPVAAISLVSQPLSSTGGRARETEQALMQRAATRIAHRKRAISWGNMRSMLMDNYPQLFDVQFPDVEKLNHIPALEVQTLLAIPNSGYRDNDDVLRPTLSAGRLTAMSEWLKQYTDLWASPELVNPTYTDVTARYRAIFISGVGPDYGYAQLTGWLQQQYMPWGEDQLTAVTPGNRVDYYQLLATLQKSPLVERVVSLTLTREGGNAVQQTVTAGENEVLILIPLPDSD